MFEELRKKVSVKRRLKKNAKALYLMDCLSEAYYYLWSKVDEGLITEEIADEIMREIDCECENVTGGDIERFTKIMLGDKRNERKGICVR